MLRPALLVFVITSTVSSAADWPQFRGPTADGLSDAKDVPMNWSQTQKVAWKMEVPGRGWSSPVFREGRLFLTTAVVTDGSDESNPKADRSLRTLCVDAASGKVLWDVEVFHQEGARSPETIHQKNGHASPTPVVTEDRLYVHFGHQGSAALDLSGKKVWENRAFRYAPRHGAGGSQILVDGKLIFNCDGEEDPFVLALDAKTGRIAWRKPRPETEQRQKFAFATCTAIDVDGNKQVVSPGAGAVDAFDPADGKHLWRMRYEGYSIVPKAVFAHGLVFSSTSYDTPDVYCIDPRGASGEITDTHVKWTSGSRAPMSVSVLVVGQEIYWVTDQGGIVTCADARFGDIHYQERIGGRAHTAAPIHAEGRIYFQDEDGKCVVLAAGKEFKKLAENDLGERSLASFAATDGALFIRTEKHLWSIGDK